MNSKLIIVEGLPSTGKSTTANAIYEILREHNYHTEFFREGDVHNPADFEGVAYFSVAEYERLKEEYPIHMDLLNQNQLGFHGGIIIPFRQVMEEKGIIFEDDLLRAITQHDIYEVPFEIHQELLLNRWKDFVVQASKSEKVTILECCFIQNPITVTMIRDGLSEEISKGYIIQISETVKELNPILIYLEQDHLDLSFQRAIQERPQEWFDFFVRYYTKQGYGLKNNLTGLDGTMQVLKERRKIELELYEALEIQKFKVNNSEYNLEGLKKMLEVILI